MYERHKSEVAVRVGSEVRPGYLTRLVCVRIIYPRPISKN